MQLGKRVRFDDLKKVLQQLVKDAHAPLERVQITGGVLAKTAQMRFVGNQATAIASAKQVFEYVRNDGAWRQLYVDSPRA